MILLGKKSKSKSFHLLFQLSNQDPHHHQHHHDSRSKPSKQEDVVMKVVRVIANLSIKPEVGVDIACSVPCVDYLISILSK